jgi:beta-mannosidase
MILSIKDFSGKELWTNKQILNIAENTSRIYFQTQLDDLVKGMDKNKIVCYAQLRVDNKSIADNFYYFTDIKNLELPKPRIRIKSDKDSIIVSTDVFAKNIYLHCDKGDVTFSDNYFDLLPGQSKSVSCHSSVSINPDSDIKVITLTDSY